VGFIRRGYSPVGGAEAYLKRLAHVFTTQGDEAVLFGSREWPEADWPGTEIVRINGASPKKFASACLAHIGRVDITLSLERVWKCDVYRAGDGVHASWLKRRTRIEPAWKHWLRPLNRKHAELLALEKATFHPNHTKRIIANSHLIASEIQTYYGFPKERIDVIPNGLPESAFKALPDRQTARAFWNIEKNKHVVLFAGSGWMRKGITALIQAAKRLPDVLFLVAGRGKLSRKPPSNVRLLGPQKELATLFAAADIFLLPTHYDPFSNACLEAFAAGLPVITTAANGFSEVLVPGRTGDILENPDDTDALVALLSDWLRDEKCTAAFEEIRSAARPFTIAENTRLTCQSLLTARQT